MQCNLPPTEPPETPLPSAFAGLFRLIGLHDVYILWTSDQQDCKSLLLKKLSRYSWVPLKQVLLKWTHLNKFTSYLNMAGFQNIFCLQPTYPVCLGHSLPFSQTFRLITWKFVINLPRRLSVWINVITKQRTLFQCHSSQFCYLVIRITIN